MTRIEYQEKMIELLDEALNNLDTDDFEIFVERIKEAIEDYL